MTFSTNFSSGTTVTSNWLNSVDDYVFDSVADVHLYGAVGDGTTDDTIAIQAALNTRLPVKFHIGKTYKITGALTAYNSMYSDGNADLLFTDGAYVGVSYTGQSKFIVKHLSFLGTNTTTPQITLLKLSTASAYYAVRNCSFAYASIGVLADGCYISTFAENNYSNCDIYFKWANTTGSTAAGMLHNEVYGTTIIGSNPCVYVAAPSLTMSKGYFETTSHTKPCFEVFTGAQTFNAEVEAHSSGGFIYHTSTGGKLDLTSYDCYNTSSLYCVRVFGGAYVDVSHSILVQTNLVASVQGISASGGLTAHGVRMSKWATGIASTDQLDLHGGNISSCTVGINATGSGYIVKPVYSSNGTNAVTGGTVVVV